MDEHTKNLILDNLSLVDEVIASDKRFTGRPLRGNLDKVSGITFIFGDATGISGDMSKIEGDVSGIYATAKEIEDLLNLREKIDSYLRS